MPINRHALLDRLRLSMRLLSAQSVVCCLTFGGLLVLSSACGGEADSASSSQTVDTGAQHPPKKDPQRDALSPPPRTLDELTEYLEKIERLNQTLTNNAIAGDLALREAEKRSFEGADLYRLARARLASKIGKLEDSISLAQEIIKGETSASIGAMWLVAEVALQCPVAAKALDSLKSNMSTLSFRWHLLKRQWSKRCAPQSLHQTELELMLDYPTSPLGLSLSLILKLSIDQRLSLAQSLERNRANLEAVAQYDLLLKDTTLSEERRWSIEYERTRILVKRVREDFVSGAKTLERLGKVSRERGRKANILAAYAWTKANKWRRAQSIYQYLVKEWKFSDEAKEARFMLAFHEYETGRYRRAIERFAPLTRHGGDLKKLKRLPARAPKRGWTQSAEWYYAWSLFLRAPSASAPFLAHQIGSGLPTSQQGRRAAYWAAKAYSSADPKRAESLRKQLIEGHASDWYTLLLRAQDPEIALDVEPLHFMNQDGVFSPSFGPSFRDHFDQITENLTEDQTPDLTEDLSNRRHWIRMKIATALRLVDVELDERRRFHQAHVQSASPSEVWAHAFYEYEHSLRRSAGVAPARLKAIPTDEHSRWWGRVYPFGFPEEVKRASRLEGVSPFIILSFIRKESAFQPRALSPAQAVGLMQLLDKTAQGVLELKDQPQLSQPIDLFDPSTNIQLGSRYLRALGMRYHDQLPLVAAGYNAGPKNLNEWMSRDERQLDVFVEKIPFKEAREYVKRLTQTECIYQLLYGQESLNRCAGRLPMRLNLKVDPGVNF